MDSVLHSTVVDKSNCLLFSMNISTGRGEIFIANRTSRAVVHSTNLSSITYNVTELLSEHFQPWSSYISVGWAHISPREISFENLMSKLSALAISRAPISRVGFAWFSWNLFWLVSMGSQVFAKCFRALAFDGMEIQLERLYWGV
jgi:hypothetical protein